MYSIILMTAMTGAPDVSAGFFAPGRTGCSGVLAARGGCTGRVAVASAGCHGALLTRQRTRTVTHTRTASVAVPAPAAVLPPPAPPVAPPKEAPVAAAVVLAPVRSVCANGNCGVLAPVRRLAFWR